MILKDKTKSLFYLDRDTNISQLADEILRVKRSEIIVFLQRQFHRLQEKELGEYYTVEDILKLKDGELEKMQRFFRGAVVPYYVRQKYNIWSDEVSQEDINKGTDELKKSVGFMKYDHTGHLTEEVNSMATFERVKDLNEFLKMIEQVCFDDNDYVFPDSKRFKDLEKEKGRYATHRQMTSELHEKFKNKFYKREIIN